MYQFSRAIYRELADMIEDGGHEDVLRSAERCVERLTADRGRFRRPARTLFADVRVHFSLHDQAR
ncbi:MAG TPA: hypothetical protein VHB30_02770, partial [Solirubrobacteraceae bacterium]|nr:hypothetical protein [Solirubrobacteraceae bacterium]